jgi:myo-inositol 2-dehydrogenase/D-chiro-inositol 1-dehydrogenase
MMISQCCHIGNVWGSVDEWAHCTGGIVHLTNNHRQCTIQRTDGTIERFSGENDNPYQIEHDDLFRAIRENTEYSEAENGAYSSMVAILGRMCTYSGKELQWDEALNNGSSIMPERYDWDADPPTLPNENGEYPIAVPGVTSVLG